MSKKAQNIKNWLNKFITQPMLSTLRSNIISTAANWVKDERFSAKKATMLAVHEANISKMQITKKYRKYYDRFQNPFNDSKKTKKNLALPSRAMLNELAEQKYKMSYAQLTKKDPHSAAAIERLARQQMIRRYNPMPKLPKNLKHYALLRIFNASLTLAESGQPEKEILNDMLTDAKPIAKEIGTTEKYVKDWVKKMKKKIGLKNPKKNLTLNSKDLAKDVVKHFGKKRFEFYDIINYIIGKFTPPVFFDDNDWTQLVIDIEHITRKRLDFHLKSIKTNPPTQAQVDKAVEIRERFSDEQVGSIRKKKISLPGPGEPLIVLAEMPGVPYFSSKDGEEKYQIWEHEFEQGSDGKFPLMCCTLDRKTIIIFGGKFKIGSYKGSKLFWLID